VATFQNLAEARDKIDYFLAPEEERWRVARRGRERCLRDHTYSVRLSQALEMVEELCPGRLPKRPRPAKPLEQVLAVAVSRQQDHSGGLGPVPGVSRPPSRSGPAGAISQR